MPEDLGSTAFERGLSELDRYFCQLDDAALRRAVDAFRTAADAAPAAAAHWGALGYALDASGRPEDALKALRRAAELDPEDRVVEVFIVTLLSEAGAEPDAMAGIEAAARRQGVDLDGLRRDLIDGGMPIESRALVLNGFIRPRNFLRSRLEDSIERAERERDPVAFERSNDLERLECLQRQDEVRIGLDPKRVPESFRGMTGWAGRLGVGDDFCRGWLAERLSLEERSEVRRAARAHTAAIQEWIDSFDPAELPAEAAAFMYLLLGVEELAPDEVEGGPPAGF